MAKWQTFSIADGFILTKSVSVVFVGSSSQPNAKLLMHRKKR